MLNRIVSSLLLASLPVIFMGCEQDIPAVEYPSHAVPVGNPDDQIRFFWGLDWRMYDSLPGVGFNIATEHPQGNFYYDFKKGKGKEGPRPDYDALTAKMKRDDFVWMIQLRPFSKYMKEKYPCINRDGTKFNRSVDITAPGCMEELRRYVEYHAEVGAQAPCVVALMPETEERIWTKPTFASHALAAYKAATGLEVPKEAEGRAAPHWSKLKDIPANRIVSKDHPLLKFYRWYWRDGQGYNQYCQMVLDIFKEKLGYTPFSMYDPSTRMPPLWGMVGNVTHNDQWMMCYPHPYAHAYVIAEQNAVAKGVPGQRVVTLVQGIAASSVIAPTNDLPRNIPEWRRKYPAAVFITPPPDMILEQLWVVSSRKIDGFGFHGWDALWVNGDDFGRGRMYYRYTNPQTRKTIERFMRDVAVPLGPLLKAIPERPSEIAVLDTYASALLSGEGYWDWYRASRGCGYLAEGANLAPSTLYEEDIAKNGIAPSIKVILAANQGVVTEETAAALKEFQQRGGKIVADNNFVPAIKPDAILPDEKSTAKIVATAESEIRADDVIPEEMKKIKDCKMRDIKWKARAAELSRICRQWSKAYVESDNNYIYLHARSYRTSDYIFAVNDKRDFGDYVGPWRRLMEKGMPNEATVTVKRTAGAVYDLEKHTAVPFTVKNGETHIPVKYETSDGRLLMVVDKPLAPLKVRAKEVDGGIKVTVTTPDKNVMIPIMVESSSGKPFYGVVSDGAWARVVKGMNLKTLKVRNLATCGELR